ncbi:MAG: class I SAM-dependent methyltransferase [Microbacterium sp.]|nr:class I SAM-dependent methyltransferase [Microbacterium sp.]
MTDLRLSPSVARLLALIDPETVIDELYGDLGSDVYDAMTRADDSEVREVLRAARRTSGRILELACGSGRLTLPLARLGREITALDSSPRMLNLLRARATGIAGVRIVEADMSDLVLDGEFGLIVLATTSVTLLTPPQRARLLDGVRQRLSADGLFLVSVHTTRPRAGGTTIVPLPDEASGVVILSEEPDREDEHREISVLHLRSELGRTRARAYASRVALLDEPQLCEELREAGFTVVSASPVRVAGGGIAVSMIEAAR